MAWRSTPQKFASSLGLYLEQTPAMATTREGNRCALTPGLQVYMNIPLGTFGVRHTPRVAGCGGSTVCIVSERAEKYVGIDEHIGTMRAILRDRDRPDISYSAARGSLESAYISWTSRHFEHLAQDAASWRANYSRESDADFYKIHLFWRNGTSREFVYFGQYKMMSFDNRVAKLSPVQATSASNLDLLADAVERLELVQ